MRQRLALGLLVGIIGRPNQTKMHHQGTHQALVEFIPATTAHVAGQHDFAKTSTDQTADGDSSSLKHAPDFAVAPLGQGDAIPAIAALTADIFQ